MTNWKWKEVVVASFKVISLRSPGGTEGKTKKNSVELVSALAKIRTGHLPSTARNRCRMTQLARYQP
jgi:hypothetical protein